MGSLQLIDRLGLYSTIFTDPTTQGHPAPTTDNWAIAYTCLNELKSNETPGSIYECLVRSDDAKYFSWVLAAITPWSQMPLPQPAKPGGKLPPPLGSLVIREGIKGENKIYNVVTGAFRHHEEITGWNWSARTTSFGASRFVFVRKGSSCGALSPNATGSF